MEKKVKSSELLKAMNEELSTVPNIKDLLCVLNKYLLFVWDFSFASFFVNQIDKNSQFSYYCFDNHKQGEVLAKENKQALQKFLLKEKQGEYADYVEKNVPIKIGESEHKRSSRSQQKHSGFVLGIGERFLGALMISSAAEEESRCDNDLIQAMVISFSMALERLRIEKNSEHSKTESLVESLADGVLMVNQKKEILLINQSFSRLTGMVRHPGIDFEYVNNLFPALDLEKLFSDAISSGFASHINEIKFFEKYFEISIGPVKDHQKEVVGASLIIHDISYLKELDKMKTEFVTVASHKLRTPLTAIKLYTDMLMSGEIGNVNQEQKDYLQNIYESSERTIRLVNDLLNLSKIESDNLQPEPQSVNVLAMIKNVVKNLEPFCEIKGTRVEIIDEAKGLGPQMIDQNLFRQVLHNLLINSIDYTRKNDGLVNIYLSVEDNDKFVITIEDNGIGIADIDKANIFTKFYRTDNAMKANTEGTGLGLYVAKRIMDLCGGRIWFQSKEQEGSSFYLALPLSNANKN